MPPIVWGLFAGSILGLVLWRLRVVTASGAVAGGGLLAAFVVLGGWPASLGFALLVVVGTLVSRIGRGRKGEAAEGPRRAGQALANAGPATLFLVFGTGGPAMGATLGALASALGDTCSSELGILARQPPRRLLFGKVVPRGADGGMTWVGTLAGVGGSACLGILGSLTLGIRAGGLIVVAGVLGNLADSVLGALVEHRLPPRFANDVVNACSSAIGGAWAWVLCGGMW
jgi:uncharacterized protein (TIGR00297 family)